MMEGIHSIIVMNEKGEAENHDPEDYPAIARLLEAMGLYERRTHDRDQFDNYYKNRLTHQRKGVQ